MGNSKLGVCWCIHTLRSRRSTLRIKFLTLLSLCFFFMSGLPAPPGLAFCGGPPCLPFLPPPKGTMDANKGYCNAELHNRAKIAVSKVLTSTQEPLPLPLAR